MIRPGDIVRGPAVMRVRESHRSARERKTWMLVEVEILDKDIEDGTAVVEVKR